MNGKETVFSWGSNYFQELELNEIESSYWAFNLILPEKLGFTWCFLKVFTHKDHSILLSWVLQTLYRALHVFHNKTLLPSVKTKTIRVSGNVVHLLCEVTYFVLDFGVGTKSATYTLTHWIPYSETLVFGNKDGQHSCWKEA